MVSPEDFDHHAPYCLCCAEPIKRTDQLCSYCKKAGCTVGSSAEPNKRPHVHAHCGNAKK